MLSWSLGRSVKPGEAPGEVAVPSASAQRPEEPSCCRWGPWLYDLPRERHSRQCCVHPAERAAFRRVQAKGRGWPCQPTRAGSLRLCLAPGAAAGGM